MKKNNNKNSHILYHLKLAFQSAGILSVVFGFVFIAYLDLTRTEVKPAKEIQTTEANVLMSK